jgi:probable DNA metabolism protein
MTTLISDGSWTGLLSCIFEMYDRKLGLVFIVPEKTFQPDVFSSEIFVLSDVNKAKRVWAGLAKQISNKALGHLYSCYLSELSGIENIICEYCRLAFEMKESPEFAYGYPAVLRVSQVDRMVHREKHRMEAFIRFKLTKDNLYYAIIEPDFNIIPLIHTHFKRRYADQCWVIYDLKRNYGIHYDLENVSEIVLSRDKQTEESKFNIFHEDEVLYQTLWKDYFKHVNITERKNVKLHLTHVPKRYWKHLTEKVR